MLFNFGQRPFNIRLNVSCLGINEPDCLINSYYDPGVQVMDFFRDFVIGFCHDQNAGISIDERLSVGCLLVEYLMPIMEDPYFLEAQVLHFLTELVQLSKPELTEAAYRVFDIQFSDEYLSKWVAHLIQACCKRLVQKPLTSHHAYENYMGVIQ